MWEKIPQRRNGGNAENCLATEAESPLQVISEQHAPFSGSFQDLPDDALLRLCAADPKAVWVLWSRHKERIERMLRSIASLSRWDMEEILSAAVLRLQVQLPRHALSIRSLPSWLTAFARNVAMDYLRKERQFHQTHLPLENTDGSLRELIDAKWVQFLDPELRRMMHSGLRSLSVRLRGTAVAHLIEGKSYSEIARIQRVSTEVVRKRLQKARARLREIAENPSRKSSASSGEADNVPFPMTEHSPLPEFAIERRPASSRILPVTGVRPEGRFHHLFFSHSVIRLEQKLRTLQSYAARHSRGWSRQLEMAEQNLSAGQFDAAFHGYQECRRHPAQALPSCLRLAQMSRFHGKIDESLWFYREALRGEHDPAARLHIEALMADLKGSKEEAQELWRAAGAIEPENPAHDLAAAEALKHDGSDERAGALLGRALRLDPGNLQARNLMLDILAWNGEHGRLQTEVERLYLDDRNAQVICDYAYFRLKKAKLSARESDHLRRLIVSGLKKTPGFPGLLHAQAAYHAVGRQWKKMAKHLDKLVLDYPARAECWTIRAVWLARLRLPGVSDSMRRAIILDPANPRLLETALYLAIRGRDAVLFRDIMKELPGPGSRNPRLLLAAAGGLLVILGDHAAAENMARRAVADCPSDPVVQFGLGRMLRLCGHTHEAVAAFSALWESIGQSPRHVLAPTVALQIGKCMAASGEREQTLRWCAAAHRCAEQFADLDPRAAADWNKLVAGIQSGNPAMFGADNEIWDSMPLPDPLYRPDFDR